MHACPDCQMTCDCDGEDHESIAPPDCRHDCWPGEQEDDGDLEPQPCTDCETNYAPPGRMWCPDCAALREPKEETMNETQQKALELAERVDALLGQAQDLIGAPDGPVTDEGGPALLDAGNYLALAAVALREAARS